MGSRSKSLRCSNCGISLQAQRLSWTVRCSGCNAITRTHSPFRRVCGLVRGVMSDNTSSTSWNLSEQSWSSFPDSYPQVSGNKRAVLCGVSYIGKRYELRGTINDVNCMKYLLTTKFGFPEECIVVLNEGSSDPYQIPTKANMRLAMHWLVHKCKPGDSLVFHFSGHGSQKVDVSGNDELDGFDETLCPLDYETNGMILDDEVNETLVRPIPHRAKLHAIVDACHSGTVLDLPYLCRINRTGYCHWEDHSPPSRKNKGTSGGVAICISGCADHQLSADTMALSGHTTTGAMTYSLIWALESDPSTTYGQLLYSMRSAIRGANTNAKLCSPVASFARKVLKSGLRQEPQLSSSEKFDIYRKPFLL